MGSNGRGPRASATKVEKPLETLKLPKIDLGSRNWPDKLKRSCQH